MNDHDSQHLDEDGIRRILQAAGKREELPEHLKRKWEETFRSDLAIARAARQRRRAALFSVVAACLVVAAATLFFVREPTSRLPPIHVVSVMGSSTFAGSGGEMAAVSKGQRIDSGTLIDTGQDGLVALAWGGYDLRVNARSRLVLNDAGLILQSGEIYASDDDSAAGQFRLNVYTPQGRIRDIGTQFTVNVSPGLTVTTVRRGKVILTTDSGEFRTEARPEGATRVTVDDQHEVHRDTVDANGRDWQWIYGAAPTFAIEGRTARDFLEWSVSESGLVLEFASKGAEHYAGSTVLHGNIEGLDPERAVDPVLAATDLSAVVEGSRLVISLNR